MAKMEKSFSLGIQSQKNKGKQTGRSVALNPSVSSGIVAEFQGDHKFVGADTVFHNVRQGIVKSIAKIKLVDPYSTHENK